MEAESETMDEDVNGGMLAGGGKGRLGGVWGTFAAELQNEIQNGGEVVVQLVSDRKGGNWHSGKNVLALCLGWRRLQVCCSSLCGDVIIVPDVIGAP